MLGSGKPGWGIQLGYVSDLKASVLCVLRRVRDGF